MSIASRVKNSIELLDSKAPTNWRTVINWECLDLANCQLCVLGQLYGDYDIGLYALSIASGGDDYAFACLDDETAKMHTEWRKQTKEVLTLLNELLERKAVVMLEADKLNIQRQALDIADEAIDRQLTDLQKCINTLS